MEHDTAEPGSRPATNHDRALPAGLEHADGRELADAPEADAVEAEDAPEPGEASEGDERSAGQRQATGQPRVDEALQKLDELAELPVSEHPAVFEHVHDRLRDVLGELDSGSLAGAQGRQDS